MDIIVKVTKVLPEQQFTSKRDGSPVFKYEFVGETEEQYPKTVMFEVWGKDRWDAMHVAVDAKMQVSFDVESREYNERWYTSCTAWRCVMVDGSSHQQSVPSSAPQAPHPQQEAPAAPQAAPAPSTGKESSDDLPF